ncbi:MAG: ATP-binding protein [Acidimicrobiales bacterium]
MLVGRTGLSPVMVGRSTELDRLTQLLGARRTPSVALIAAEAGVGKTRLVQELVAHVPDGTVVLAGQADPGTLGRPLELFLDALDGVRLEAHAGLLDVVGGRGRPVEERVRAGVELVEHLTASAVGLIVFEDLHWADSESLSLFEQLTAPDAGRLVLVGTYRPDALSRRHPAADLLTRLERRHTVTHVNLGRLGAGDVSAFLTAVYGAVPSFRVVDALHTRTGGNPFFLEELISPSSRVDIEDLSSLPLPWSVAELVRGHVDELGPDERRIVSAASVMGRRVSFDLLAAVTRTPEDDLIEVLRTLVEKGLLVETDPDVFGFRHELSREAIEGGLLGRERRRLHEAALEGLRASDSRDFAAIARHADGSGRPDDMVAAARHGAVEYLAVGSTYQALQLAELGLSVAEDDVNLLSMATRSAWLAGLVADACDHADHWLRLAREADDVSEEASALSMRMRVAWEAGDMEAMAEFTDALIDIIDGLPSDEERARAMAFVAQSYMLRDLCEPTCEWADKAYALADAHGLADVSLAATVEKGSALMSEPGCEDEGAVLLRAAAAEAERTGEHVLASRALNNLLWHDRHWDNPDEVRALVERVRQQAEAGGFDSLARIGYVLANLAAVEGDLDAAIAHLVEGQRNQRGAENKWFSLAQVAYALEVGDLEAAEQYARDAHAVAAQDTIAAISFDVQLACWQGQPDRARMLLARLLDSELVVSRYPGAAGAKRKYARAPHVHDIVAAALRAGLASAELRPLVEQAAIQVGRRLEPDDPWRRFLDAQLAEAERRIDEGAEGYVAAATALEPSNETLAGHRGTAHVGAARCLIGIGRLQEARAHAEQAAEILARWRGWRVDELHAVQRRLGLGPEQTGPDSLTPREREVVALLAEGLTNSQVADRLYISPRTAAVHVSNILAKLGMSSRTEVAAWAVREGLGATR